MTTEASISNLVEHARAGDLAAFTELVSRFQAMAYGYAYSVLGDFALAEDAAQEAFLEAHRRLGDLREAAAFPGWFRRIVFKYCDRIARSQRAATVPLDAVGELRSGQPGPEAVAEQREREAVILDAIRTLPRDQRIAVTLFYIDGYSQQEVATFLDVQVSTVKNRLYTARKGLRERLEERTMTMMRTTLNQHTLPEYFAHRLLRYPFPRREPVIEIVALPEKRLRVHCIDAQSQFVPLAPDGKCDWTFYDWPGARLTGIYECHVIAATRWEAGTLLREWERYTDLEQDKVQWEEHYILIEDDTYRWVDVQRGDPGMLQLAPHRYHNGQVSESWPMTLEVGQAWGEPPERSWVAGAARVTIGDRTWTCLEVTMVTAQAKETAGTPVVLARWYVAESGRTVFFRRFNAAGFRDAGAHGSFEALEGNQEIVVEGVRYRHWYDCIPDHALAP